MMRTIQPATVAGARILASLPSECVDRRLVLHIARLVIEAEIEVQRRWTKWAHDLGYPFDFTNSDAIPDNAMLDAIAQEWMGDGWESFDEVQYDVYEEVGVLDRLPIEPTA